ncbi:hypothetical protein, partial [Neisseria gonorrhoeae]
FKSGQGNEAADSKIVRQGEVTPYWFKFNPLYLRGINGIFWWERRLFETKTAEKPVVGCRLFEEKEFCKGL